MSTYDYSWYELPLAYGFPFDLVRPQGFRFARPYSGDHDFANHPPALTTLNDVHGRRFYQLNGGQLYRRPILKLHGSLNWLTDIPTAARPYILLTGSRPTRSLDNGFSPLIITPMQQKNYERWPFPELWAQAAELLAACQRLVIIGYSFPDTDFETRRLLREAFATNAVGEVVVVNPCPTHREVALKVVNHTTSVAYNTLDDFVVGEGLMEPRGQ